MSKRDLVPYDATLVVRDTCLCLHIQRAARSVARFFDQALRPVDLTNGQFSLMMALNRPTPPNLGSVANLLAMDRTTLTAALKPLQARGLVMVGIDPNDRRNRVLTLTTAGHAVLAKAWPIWTSSHRLLEDRLGEGDPDQLRRDLRALVW